MMKKILTPFHIAYLIFDFINQFRLIQVTVSIILWYEFLRYSVLDGPITIIVILYSFAFFWLYLFLMLLLSLVLRLLFLPLEFVENRYQKRVYEEKCKKQQAYQKEEHTSRKYTSGTQHTNYQSQSKSSDFDWNAYRKSFEKNTKEQQTYHQNAHQNVPNPLNEALKTLGFPYVPTAEALKKKKRELLKKYHPDSNKSPNAVEMTERILSACEELEHYAR